MAPNAFQAGSYGWRARLGMLKPSPVIDTNCHEFYLMAPAGVELLVTSLGLAEMSSSEYERAIREFEGPLRALLRREPDSIVQAGVPPIVTRGAGFGDELTARVRAVTEIPFFTDINASTLALSAMGCANIAVVSHNFDDQICDAISSYLKPNGIAVVVASRVGDTTKGEAVSLPLEAVYRCARRTYERCRGVADAIWITEASMPSVGVIEALEEDLGCPVVSSAQAMMWAGLRAVGIRDQIPRFGRLFEISQLTA